jgi:hypothetical protein
MGTNKLDALIETVLQVVTDDGIIYRAAAERVLSETSPDNETTARLLVIGLGECARDTQHKINDNKADEGIKQARFHGRYQLNTQHMSSGEYLAMERVRLIGADGAIKALADFDIEDVRHLEAEAEAVRKGALSKRAFARGLAEALAAHHATSWRELPQKSRDDIERLAGGVWS